LILREWHLERLRWLLSFSPVAAILGARQVGKTTLAKQLVASWEGPVTWFDLEAPEDLARLQEPMLALERLRGLVVLDEIQRMPGLCPLLLVLADREGEPARFLVLGSASPELVRGTSESLAGRIAFLELGGFSMRETGPESLEALWVRGRFPRAFLAKSEEESVAWRRDLVRTFVERDLPQLGLRLPPVGLHRFWTMLAHLHGQILNTAALGRSMGVTAPVVRRYLDLMTGAFLVRQLQPWHENVGKRLVRHPKTYLADSGFCTSCSGSPAGTIWRAIRSSAPRGRAMRYRSSSRFSTRVARSGSSGPCTPEPNSTCSWSEAGGASDSRSSARRRRASPAPCGLPWTSCAWIRCT